MLKKTKIIATISDRKCDVEFLKTLHQAGMNLVRINTAHQTPETTIEVIKNIRQVSENLPIIVDTKGPEVRTTGFGNPIIVKEGDLVTLDCSGQFEDDGKTFSVSYPHYIHDIKAGNTILIDDGDLKLTVVEIMGETARCRVENDGKIEPRKSVNTPSVSINLPSLSPKDIDFIHFAIEQEVDFIAHSFVRNRNDILAIQKILDQHKSPIKIIAKIENKEGIDNLDEILDHAYGVMVARGDLAIEIALNKIPVLQKKIVTKCILRRKPVIVATQMLHSMISNPRPTRAEVSDVANAIFDGVDAIMLSGETAYGKYPVEAVKVMADIARESETTGKGYRDIPHAIINNEISAYLARSAVQASKELSTKAIVADTTTGTTIRGLAAYRCDNTIYAMCYDKKVMRQLVLSYGVSTHYLGPVTTAHHFIREALAYLKEEKVVEMDDRIIIVAGNFGPAHGASYIEVSTVDNLNKKVKK